jgi:GT2 family glycosyltransferase
VLSNQSRWVEHRGFLVSSLSFKKSFMLEHGMFHEWPAASDEDLELGQRLRRCGMTIVENPNALGYHHHAEDPRSVARRAYTRGYNSHYFADRRNIGSSGAFVTRAQPSLRKFLRSVFVNGLTMRLLILPAMRMVEHARSLEPIMPALYRTLCSYHYDRGVSDYHRGMPLDRSRGEA